MPMQAVHEFEAVGRTPVAEQDLGAVRFDFSSNDCRRLGFGVGCLTDAGAADSNTPTIGRLPLSLCRRRPRWPVSSDDSLLELA